MQNQVDPDFAARVAQYERNRENGLVFQAQGTVGGVMPISQPSKRRIRWIPAVVFAGLVFVVLKASALHIMGISSYNSSLTRLTASSAPVDRALGYILRPDAASIQIALVINRVQHRLLREMRLSQ
jgi:hypothetical protein